MKVVTFVPVGQLQNIGMRKSYSFVQNEKILPMIARLVGFLFVCFIGLGLVWLVGLGFFSPHFKRPSLSSGRQICYFGQKTRKEGSAHTLYVKHPPK